MGGSDDAINGMLGALGVGVTASIVSGVANSMINNMAKPKSVVPVRRKVAPRPIAPRAGKVVRKIQSTEGEKFNKINQLGYGKAKALGIKQGVMFRNPWNGDFSNIGF